MCVQSGHYDGVYTEFLEEDVQVGLEEAAVTAFRDDIVLFAEFQFRNDFGTGGADDGVVTPEGKFLVYPGTVCVIAENDRQTSLAGGVEQARGGGDDGYRPFTGEGAVNEVLEHVDDQHGGMVEDQWFLV